MGGMWLPTLAGLARLSPVKVIAQRTNVAGSAAATEYTVPAGRMAVITHLTIAQTGGVAYSSLGFEMLIAGAGNAGAIIEEALVAVFASIRSESILWLTETDTIQSVVRGGDATSDYQVYIGGAEFDWADVT